jgi:carbonic anhydrase
MSDRRTLGAGRRLVQKRVIMLHVLLATILVAGAVKAAAPSGEGVEPGTALKELLEGNQRYVDNAARHPGQRPSDDPQHPIAAVLSCSDSRVPPEIIFDQGVGTLFVARVAGNTYNALVLQSIEYAVTNLGVRLIIVMGHDQCGAVSAAIKAYPERMAGAMLKNIYPAVRATKGMSGDPVANAVAANAELVAQGLAGEPTFEPLVKSGQLKIVAARYALASGRVVILPDRPEAPEEAQ